MTGTLSTKASPSPIADQAREIVDPAVRRDFERFLAGWASDLLVARRLGLLSFDWRTAPFDDEA